ncbi:MAG UNVERIFIED_CONTAM: hypothetical protein LVT10_13920 [Anaerolineae bacterium]
MPTFSTMKLTALPETVPCLQRQAKRNLPSCSQLGMGDTFTFTIPLVKA